MNVNAVMLRVRLLTMRAGPAACVALALVVLGAASAAWMVLSRDSRHADSLPPVVAPTLVQAAPLPTANENLAAFYAALGDKRYAEQQVKVLFDLASKTGLSLQQGEYKVSYDKAAHFSTYQVMLPVKGPYHSIWQFSLQALTAMPFAALDEVSFRRESITEPTVEARLRFTIYLKDGGQP